jgi:parallel beta-helix repeat protein
MKKLVVLALLAIGIFNCGKDTLTNPNHGITVTISPRRMLINIGTTFQFASAVEGASNQAVNWRKEGGVENGSIDILGVYTAPSVLPANVDSVKIIAIAAVDTTKTATGWAVLVDPSKIYVDTFGSDANGIGTRARPYRTITKALTLAYSTQLVIVGPGEYNTESGEHFPLHVPFGVTVQGAGKDSSYVTCPGGDDYSRDTVFVLGSSATTIEKFTIRSANSQGIGVAVSSASFVQISNNRITANYIGIYSRGALLPRPIIDGNFVTGNSIGIVTANSSGPLLRNNNISDCSVYGIEIRDFGRPDLGLNDTTYSGQNTIVDCGSSNHWLIYNNCPDTIWAVGNTWPYPSVSDNDNLIYDDEESGGVSGPVILENQHP